MQKNSEARSFVKKIHNEINERNERSNKRKHDLLKKVLNDKNLLSIPQNLQFKGDEIKVIIPNTVKKIKQVKSLKNKTTVL